MQFPSGMFDWVLKALNEHLQLEWIYYLPLKSDFFITFFTW